VATVEHPFHNSVGNSDLNRSMAKVSRVNQPG